MLCSAMYNVRANKIMSLGVAKGPDIWCNILSLMPIEDSARSACVSHTFLRSWRHQPNLIFTEKTLGLIQNACGKGDIASAFASKIDQIMKKHSSTGVKILELDMFGCRDLDICHLDSWLEIAITPGIEKLTLSLPLKYNGGYSFPYFYLLKMEAHFGIFGSAAVPSAPQLALVS